MESLIKENKIRLDKLHNYRFHLLLVLKYVTFTHYIKNNNVIMNSDEFCKLFLNILEDKEKSSILFNKTIEIMQNAVDSWVNELKKSKFSIKDNKDFTIHILNILKSEIPKATKMPRPSGYVNNVIYRNGKYFGFINFGSSSIYFDQRSLNNNQKLDETWKKRKVNFDILVNNQGKNYAKNVEMV